MTTIDPRALTARILELQDSNGRIRWIEGGLYDPWNHGEAAMGLAVAGEGEAARRALEHLADTQRSDGSWQADMGCAAELVDGGDRLGLDAPQVVDTNFAAYVATTVWHIAATLGDRDLLHRHADMVARALEFVLAHQRGDGAVVWRALEGDETVEDLDALLAGGASIYKSLECGIRILDALDRPTGRWHAARARLGHAIRKGDPCVWALKSEYAMDWYYPALCGALSRKDARARLAAGWRTFVEPGHGCRCVSHEPWATAAETAELAITLAAVGANGLANHLLEALNAMRAPAGDVWMGWQFAENRAWPIERPSWTAGALLLAYDVTARRSNGASVFLESLPERPSDQSTATADTDEVSRYA